MNTGLDRIIFNHEQSVAAETPPPIDFKFKRYCISNLRGGIGKSTLSFNIAFLMSRHKPTLIADLCAQCNLTEAMMRGDDTPITIADALRPRLMGPAFGEIPTDISYKIGSHNHNFKGGKGAYFIPGSGELFAFPSSLYQQLQQAVAQNNRSAVKNILLSLRVIMDAEAAEKNCEIQLTDCSPFYAGATHLAWCASEALIIPVRVDEHSLESLALTLKMLGDPTSDFNMWNERAGGMDRPKVASIVMTMVGARSTQKGVKDRASLMYIERAYEIAAQHARLFDKDPADAVIITDDFVSAGRISGAEGIPIPNLKVGKFHTVGGKRLQVNSAQSTYQRELEYLVSVL
jgi:chromosome partitioning protein